MNKRTSKLLMLALGILIGTLPPPALPDDIDLFVGARQTTANNPNILIILDNGANWSQAAQKLTDAPTEGQGEVLALKAALNALGTSAANVNVGIMQFVSDKRPGGQITYAVQPMTAPNLTALNNVLVDAPTYNIYDRVNNPSYKIASGAPYGDLMQDAYNYFMGNAPLYAPQYFQTTPSPGRFDPKGYTDSTYARFKAPGGGSGCNHNFIIFVGNAAGGNDPNPDTPANTAALTALHADTTQPQTALFAINAIYSNLGYSKQCYTNDAAGASSCSSTEPASAYATQCADFGGYNGGPSCQCDITKKTSSLPACATGTQRYSVFGTNTGSTSTSTTTTSTSTGTSACYTSSTAASSASDHGGLTCPANTDTGAGSNPRVVTTYSCAYSYGTTGGGSCPATAGTPTTSSVTGALQNSTGTSSGGSAAGCYLNAASCTSVPDKSNLTCPTNTAFSPATCSSYPCTQTQTTHSCSYSCGATGASCTVATGGPTVVTACSAKKTKTPSTIVPCTTNSTTPAGCDANTPICPANTATRTYTCSAATVTTSSQANNGTTCGGSGANATWPINRTQSYTDTGNKFTVTQADSPTTVTKTTPAVSNFTYGVTQTVTKTVQTTTNNTSTTNLGTTSQCYASLAACSTSDYSSVAGNYSGGLSCNNPTTTTGSCPNNGVTYQVQGIGTGEAPTGTMGLLLKSPINSNLWTQYMSQNGIASTYTIDVYGAHPQAMQSAQLNSMAKLGGGKYYTASSTTAIEDALAKILNEIQSVNSTFASAALPVNATNRAQNQNQVFIGMFRPDPTSQPRWYGNLKQYQLIKTGTGIELGDSLGVSAVNVQTGFISNCAVSFWSNDSGAYWKNVPTDTFAKSQCSPNSFSPWSDVPDGPLVEKGATGEIQRQGNNPGSTPTYLVDSNRKMLTLSGSTLVPFNSTNAPSLSTSVVGFTQGKDLTGENTSTGGATSSATRPSIHGDVIHSRPLPITYSSSSVVAYYGANDGTLRGVNASTGKELWSFVPPEFFPRLSRLMDNSPSVKFPNGTDPTATPKDYFFDGSIGAYQNADNTKVWIYPSMRRGGRMIYGLDVTDPTVSPTFKWRVGCPDLTDDTGCTTTGLTGIGQTWSLPNVAFVNGYSTTTPVIVVGGGYDSCEDANTGTPSCSSPKGKAVYVLNADTGAVLASFPTTRSVAADVSLVDTNADGSIDYAYAADTGGNIYRLNFVNSSGVSQAASGWSMTRVAYTNGANRKFLFGPAVLPARGGRVYLALGSGDREHPLISQYPYPGALGAGDAGVVNRFYVYVDNLAGTTATNLDDTAVMNDAKNAGCDPNTMIYPTSSKSGWFLDLNKYGAGEQTVTSAVIAAGLATFSTNRPTVPTANSCSNLGEARGYLVSLFNGSGAIGVDGSCGGQISNTFVGGGLPPSPVLATVPIEGVAHTVFIGAVQKDGSTSTIIQSQQIDPTISSKRKQVYWKKSGDN